MGELRTTNTDLNVEILGVNQIGQDASNPLMTALRTMPWLQDTKEKKIWEAWQVTYRDVRILDTKNQVRAVFNLTEHDLSLPSNRQALKQLFLDAAQIVDADKDGLPDDWEEQFLGNVSGQPDGDPDGDGVSNMSEFVFGTNPLDGALYKPFTFRVSGTPQAPLELFLFRRRTGSFVKYTIESSFDLKHWTPLSRTAITTRNLFDGTGRAEVTCKLPSAAPGSSFLRVLAGPR